VREIRPLRSMCADRTSCREGVRYLGCWLDYRQRVITTRVPRPTVDSTSNSLTKRLAPGSPSPKPSPEVQPFVMARSISGMPGPLSSNLNRMPGLVPALITSHENVPPPPWMSVLRASSLAAVTNMVCPVIENFSPDAISLTIRRHVTMSKLSLSGSEPEGSVDWITCDLHFGCVHCVHLH